MLTHKSIEMVKKLYVILKKHLYQCRVLEDLPLIQFNYIENTVKWQFYHLVSNNKHIKMVCMRLSPFRDGYNELNQLSIADD